MTKPLAIDLKAIKEASRALAGHVRRTPTAVLSRIAALAGAASVTAKLENLQDTGSFKVRGALNRLLALDGPARGLGVVAASAGNHAQGVAFHAGRLGVAATIVMPEATPFTKIARTEALGASVRIEGATLTEARTAAENLAEETGATFIHPYNDPLVMAGQGTAGLEMLEDAPQPFDDLIVPIGGGGLISGIATAVRALRPEVRIIGVQVASYSAMRAALKGGSSGTGGPTIAEGIAVKGVGNLTRDVIAATVDDVLVVEERAIEIAVQLLLEEEHIVAEGAGAAPVALLLEERERFAGRAVGLVVSGGNIDSRLLGSILMRGLVRDGRIVRLRIEIPDRPGMLARVADIIGRAGADIVEIFHQRLFYDVPVRLAELDVVVETRDPRHVAVLVKDLNDAGFQARILSGRAAEP